MKAAPETFLKAIAPYRDGLVVAVECIFTGYGLADLGAEQGIPFVLGHTLLMNAIPGGKAKHDQIDSQQIAALRRGGRLPHADVDPAHRRATRDLLRRRTHLMHKRSELLSHVQHTNSPDNLPEIGKKSADKANCDGVAERFDDAAGQQTIDRDLFLRSYGSRADGPSASLDTQGDEPEVSMPWVRLDYVLEHPGVPRSFIPEPDAWVGYPLWPLKRR